MLWAEVKMRHFLFGIHCHQPLDNFHNVLDTAINKSYLPFLQTAAKFRDFKFAVHYSGWLLEYLKNHSSETFKLLRTLADNGQVEFFSGGFYEPILAAIPSAYRRMQVEKLNNFIRDNFGQTPKGLWLTERVWDPAIIPDLAACGIEHVIVDDYHFISAGFSKETLYGYYKTEQDGDTMNIFPIDQKLRYIVPYRDVPEIDAYINTIHDHRDHAAVIFDDGEKFGLWPDSHEWVYTKGWLTRFLEYLTSQQHVVSAHFGEFTQKEKPLGIVYLPSVSYREMGEWALFADKIEELEQVAQTLKAGGLQALGEIYVKGSIWQNFLVKYPEANRMHKRSLALAKKALEFNDAAFKEIVCKTQVNDALWHGIFGGLYLPNLRNNLYRYIIEAGLCLDKLANTKYPVAEKAMFDYDGYAKITLRTATVNAIFDTRDNGQMVAFENRPDGFNYQNTLARHREGYHKKMLAPPDALEQENTKAGEIATIHEAVLEVDDKVRELLHFDWYSRNSFIDHVVERFDAEAFANCSFQEFSDLTNRPADDFILEKEQASVTFIKKGGIFQENIRYACELSKHYTLTDKDELKFKIGLRGDFPKAYTYVLEFNFHFNDFNGLSINQHMLTPNFRLKSHTFTLCDNNAKTLKLTFDKEVELYAVLINTVSQSEQDVDLTAQALALFVPFELADEVVTAGSLQILG